MSCVEIFFLRCDVATAKLLSSSLWAMLETTTTSSSSRKKALIYTLHPRIQLKSFSYYPSRILEGIVVSKKSRDSRSRDLCHMYFITSHFYLWI